mmetsp:Transcript_19989/g.41028  ORF Transcript_19989/g.41028 Transcript_19989/m.41028 type:complete len:165 (-) Transcript_19989:157-651(-)|eukprot:CAMPEP_0171609712 /NCGR_PEP_ID=MMETSP0990-20121206/9638_1 /TAXON_ID=483369 /ORGANISM="non described non described, Strain CCMP2098" /LENGTH=164 /DNA_ID=CAMNT_0012173025 /DNA_START=143 /DNA_END=637 /DNA_ORIENTATION=-
MDSCFVTVGTTKFDLLIEQFSSDEIHEHLRRLGVKRLILQIGHGREPQILTADYMLPVEFFRFCPSIEKYMLDALLIVSHAGAGSIMEALSLRKPLLVVTNDDLMGAHQSELADALQERGYLKSTAWKGIANALQFFDCDGLQLYPDKDLNAFPRLCETTMGFC